jgi:hypothetical protein
MNIQLFIVLELIVIVLVHGSKVVGAALDDERAFGGQRRQATNTIAFFCAFLKLLRKHATLEGECIEGRELWRRFACDV